MKRSWGDPNFCIDAENGLVSGAAYHVIDNLIGLQCGRAYIRPTDTTTQGLQQIISAVSPFNYALHLEVIIARNIKLYISLKNQLIPEVDGVWYDIRYNPIL